MRGAWSALQLCCILVMPSPIIPSLCRTQQLFLSPAKPSGKQQANSALTLAPWHQPWADFSKNGVTWGFMQKTKEETSPGLCSWQPWQLQGVPGESKPLPQESLAWLNVAGTWGTGVPPPPGHP